MAGISQPCECQELKEQLENCKERKHKDCEETTKEQSEKIVQTGYETTISGTSFSLQKIEIQAKDGKIG